MKYVVHAKQTKEFEVPVEASSAAEAFEILNDWIEDDFEDFQVAAQWDFVEKLA